MTLTRLTDFLVLQPAGALRMLSDPLALALRVWVSLEFLRSGWLKLTSWENTLFLFREEYHTPVLPPVVAAVLGTVGELAFPVLLIAGLTARLAAIGLSAVNVMAVISYAHVLLAEGFEAAFAQHLLWGLALLVLVVHGPGRWSADALFCRMRESQSSPGRMRWSIV